MKKIFGLSAIALSAIALASCGGVKEKKYSNEVSSSEYSLKLLDAFMAYGEEDKDYVLSMDLKTNQVAVTNGNKSTEKSTISMDEKYDKENEVLYRVGKSTDKVNSKSEKKANTGKTKYTIQKEDEEYYQYNMTTKTYYNLGEYGSSGSVNIQDYISEATDHILDSGAAKYYYDENGDSKLFTICYEMPEHYEGESIFQMEFSENKIEMYAMSDYYIDYNNYESEFYKADRQYDTKVECSFKMEFKSVELKKVDKANYKEEISL